MLIKVRNTLDINSPKTFLAVKESLGTATLRVKNTAGLTASWAVQIGKTGVEQSEIKLLGTATPSGTTITLTANTSFDHPADTPIYGIKWDQVVFKKSTSGTSGTASAITNGTISITPDQEYTFLDDTSYATTDAYKAAFRNSVTGNVSADSDWLEGTGFSFYSLAKLRERIKRKLFAAGFIKEDIEIDDVINEWLEQMNNAAVKVNQSYSLGTVNVPFSADTGLGTVSSSDFKELKRMWITYNGVDKYKATKRDISTFYPDEVVNSTHPFYSWRGNTVFEIMPRETGGTAEIIYSQRTSYLENDADDLPMQMRAYTNSFVNYALGEMYYRDRRPEMGDRFNVRAQASKNDFIAEITPRDKTGVELIDLDFAVDADGDVYL